MRRVAWMLAWQGLMHPLPRAPPRPASGGPFPCEQGPASGARKVSPVTVDPAAHAIRRWAGGKPVGRAAVPWRRDGRGCDPCRSHAERAVPRRPPACNWPTLRPAGVRRQGSLCTSDTRILGVHQRGDGRARMRSFRRGRRRRRTVLSLEPSDAVAGRVFGQDGRPHAHPDGGGSSHSDPTYASARIPPPRAWTVPTAATSASNVALVEPAGMMTSSGASTPAPPSDRDTSRSDSAGTAVAWRAPGARSTRWTAPTMCGVRVDGGGVMAGPLPSLAGSITVTAPSTNSPPADAWIVWAPPFVPLKEKISWSAPGDISTDGGVRTAAGSAPRRIVIEPPPSSPSPVPLEPRGPSWRTIPYYHASGITCVGMYSSARAGEGHHPACRRHARAVRGSYSTPAPTATATAATAAHAASARMRARPACVVTPKSFCNAQCILE